MDARSSRRTGCLIPIFFVIFIDVIAISIFNELGVIPGLWSPAFTTIISLLTVGVPIIHILISWNYEKQKLEASNTKNNLLGSKTSNSVLQVIRIGTTGGPALFFMLILLLIISIAPLILYGLNISSYLLHYPCTALALSPANTGAIKINLRPNGECIGVSNSTLTLDVNSKGTNLKQQASIYMKAGQVDEAAELWSEATKQDPSDAEARIYLADYDVVRKHPNSYIALVVVATLTGNEHSVSIGRDILQGAYVAQTVYNHAHQGKPLFLYIANSGDDSADAVLVAEQIVKISQASATTGHPIVGVMGWPFTEQSAVDAQFHLAKANIPMVSSTAMGDKLTGLAPSFFRVVPSNYVQAALTVRYAKKELHAKRAVILVESQDAERMELADDFSQQFKGNNETIVAREEYSSDGLNSLLNTLENTHADLIYFSGNIDGLSTLLAGLPTSGKLTHLQVLTADPFDELSRLSSKLKGSERLHFTLMATADEWHWLGRPAAITTFLDDYQQDFSSKMLGNGTIMLSYDAMIVLLKGCDIVEQDNTSLTPSNLQHALSNITGNQAIQGVTGRIAFSKSEPYDKLLIIAHIDSSGHIKEDLLEGHYQ